MQSGARALCDSGPLVALFDPHDQEHRRCRASLEGFSGHLVTTWPVLTEVFYFLSSNRLRDRLWDFVIHGGISIADLLPVEMPRLGTLMSKYADLPMDFADASLVVVSERFKLKKVFTLDRRDFQVYCPRHVRNFDIFP